VDGAKSGDARGEGEAMEECGGEGFNGIAA
jgi:hypothetical protein